MIDIIYYCSQTLWSQHLILNFTESSFNYIATEAAVKLEKIVANTMLKNDVKKLSPRVQTSSLESFHNVLLGWMPKNTGYSYIGMVAR
jgi:hypothetical protein